MTTLTQIPRAFCSLATKASAHELFGLLLSLSVHHPNSKVYLRTDTETKNYILRSTPKLPLNISYNVCLDEYTNTNRSQMDDKSWTDFMKQKIFLIKDVLKQETDVLFLDSDIILTAPQIHEQFDLEYGNTLGVSPAYIKKKNTDEVGYYNGGYIWVAQEEICDKWLEVCDTSRYHEQACIEDLTKIYQYFEFGEEFNIQGWRHLLSPFPIEEHFSKRDGKIIYKNKTLRCIHTHLRDERFSYFNKLIITYLLQNKDYKHLAILFRIIYGNWVITIPKQPIQGIGFHKNDSFRELIQLAMETTEDLSVIEDPFPSVHCKLHPNILLYDRPSMEWMNQECDNMSLVYMGNGDYKCQQDHDIEFRPWTFWGRRPSILEKNLPPHNVIKEYDTIFIGNIENNIQGHYRLDGEWEDVIDKYIMTKGQKHLLTQEEYLDEMKKAKYGLCLRGYGMKTHREIECLALGVVPIMTNKSAQHSYLEPLIKGKHYIECNKPQELPEILKNITEEKRMEMIQAGQQWFYDNCHSRNILKNILEDLLFKQKVVKEEPNHSNHFLQGEEEEYLLS